jgi:serine/threonine protein kinase/tetratricopeptide (TPR) repeat protein
MEEKEFINEAIKRGLVTFEQIQQCQKEQGSLALSGINVKIWEVLVLKKLASQERVQAVLSGTPGAKAHPFGPYLIHAKLGEGGMGVVYRATRQGGDQSIALKVLPDRFAESDQVQRFEREARIAIALSHPNLVKGFEFGKVGQRYYYAMEFVKGRVLSALIKERKRLEERASLQIIAQVAGALQLIHEHGLVHRDVKPDNIIIGEDGVAKLMDLGLVKSSLQEMTQLTQSGVALGTPHYMAPEQYTNKEADPRSDIYALGATLYHAVTGEKPFRATTAIEIFQQQAGSGLEDPKTLRPDLSDSVCLIVEKMMAREPEDRYPTMLAAIDDLKRVLDGKPPLAARVAVGRSLIRRPASARPEGRRAVSKRSTPEPARSSKGLAIGLSIGAAVLVAAVVGIVAAMSGPPARPRPPDPPVDRTADLERKIQKTIESGSLGEAARMIREEPSLAEPRRGELQARVASAAEKLWQEVRESARAEADFGAARRRIEEFRTRTAGIDGFAPAVEDLLVEIAGRERQIEQKKDAQTRMALIEDSARALEANEEYERALALLEGAMAAAGDNPALAELLQARIRKMKHDMVRRPPPATPAPVPSDTDVEQLWARAQKEYDARSDQVLVTLTEMAARAPKDARPYALRAMTFFAKGNIQNARLDADRAVELDGSNARARLALGMLLLHDNSLEDSLAEIGVAVKNDPTLHEAYWWRAAIYLRQNKGKEALADLDQAAALRAQLSSDRDWLGMRLSALDQTGRRDDLLLESGAWISRDPKDARPHYWRGRALLAQGKPKEAQAAFDNALSLDPKDPQALAGKEEAARALLSVGKPPNPAPPVPKPEEPILDGLRWLARHQSPGGAWMGTRHAEMCGKREYRGKCAASQGSGSFDTGLTGLCLLAFLGAGYGPSSADSFDGLAFGEVVDAALNWLISQQNAGGCVGNEGEAKFMYSHIVATLALVNAYRLAKADRLKDPAQRAVDYILKAQNPGKGWRYAIQPNDNDTSVTGWAAHALIAAEAAGLKVQKSALVGALAWVQEATDPNSGEVGYADHRIGKVMIPGVNESFEHHPTMSAVALWLKSTVEKSSVRAWTDLLMADLPQWDGAGKKIDVYYWYLGTLALHASEAASGANWKKWTERARQALAGNQNRARGSCAQGSWEPVDRWCSEGGRVYMTAMSVLTLQKCSSKPEGPRNPVKLPPAAREGLRGEYFGHANLTSLKATRIDPAVNFDWGGGRPHPEIAEDRFSVRWTGKIVPKFSELYKFTTISDDGVRLWVNGKLIIDKWINQAAAEWTGQIELRAGQKYALKLEMYEDRGEAVAKLFWSSPSQPKEIVPSGRLIPE